MRNPSSYAKSVNRPMWPLLPARAARALDVGGGHGTNVAAVKSKCGSRIAGVVDIAPDAIEHHDRSLDFAICDDIEQPGVIEAIHTTHGPFDLVLCLDVLEHLADPWRVIARLHSIMPDGGTAIASIPNIQNYRAVYRVLTGTWNYRASGLFDRTHLRYFARSSAVELMECSGLRVDAVCRALGHHRLARIADRLSLGLLGPFTTLQYQIRARRFSGDVRDPGSFGSNVSSL